MASEGGAQTSGGGYKSAIFYSIKDNLRMLLKNIEVRYSDPQVDYVVTLKELELFNVDHQTGVRINVQRNKEGLEQKILKKARLQVGG